jgi:DNA helicase IV
MTKINLADETQYLNFVKKNITDREIELERLRSNASQVAADNKTRQTLRDFYKNVRVPDRDNPYFVRVDLKGGEVRYYGYIRLAHGGHEPVPLTHLGVDDQLILSARSDGKGYTADYPENLPDLVARTRFMISGGKILKISEEFFDGSADKNQVIAADVVTESIQQTRNKKMQPISSTLQPDQFKITREPLTHSLAIQGPPGSGKTAVLLERLARIAFADESVYTKGMLLIGPNKPFMEYVSTVLPILGESEIQLRSIDQLSDYSAKVTSPKLESEALIYLKGSEEMKFVLENLVETQIKVLSKTYFLKIMDLPIEFTAADSFRILQSIADESHKNVLQMRRVGENRIKNLMVEKLREAWLAKNGNLRGFQTDPAALISQESTYKTIIRNMFPGNDSESLLAKLKSDATYFVEVSKGVLGAEDQLAWIEESETQASLITPFDVPMLDYLDSLLSDPIKKWGHIAIDEAQDLSPMEMAMVSRRLDANASLSVAGDLAQATGTQYYESWHDILLLFEQELNYTEKELKRSYRVPSEILKYAQQFLDATGVKVSPSEPFLERPGSLTFHTSQSQELGITQTITMAEASLVNQESLLVIACKADREKLSKFKFEDNGNAYVRVMEPTEVKGLEFDAVIILNPEKIIEGYEWEKSRFARLFYVLTTRSTKRLSLIGTRQEILENPLADLEDDLIIQEAEKFLADLGENYSLDEVITRGPIEIQAQSDSEVEVIAVQEIEDISILDLCENLNVNIKQASGDFLVGHWLFAGTSQLRCSECGDKPQLVFAKHKSDGTVVAGDLHIYAIGCPGCFVVRSFDSERHGNFESIKDELKITDLLKAKCPSCEGR